MADNAQPTTEGTAPVTDRRPTPQGVLPRRMQMWLMLGLAFGILAIIMLTGQTTPAERPASAAPTPQPLALSADRLRDYQDRLRVIDDRARQEPVTQPLLANPSQRAMYDGAPAATATPDPLVEERKRHEYESLFASNVVMSRRPDAQQLMNSRSPSRTLSARPMNDLPAPPSLDDVAASHARERELCVPPAAWSAREPFRRRSQG